MSSNSQEKIAAVKQQFEEDAKQVASVSESTLLKILAHNQDTEYGKKHDFSKITSLQQFKAVHPLSTYERYRDSVRRMFDGEENILTADPVIFFAQSSGTTSMGSQKMIPNTSYRGDFPWELLVQDAINRAFPIIKDGDLRILVVNANEREYKTESGVRVGNASTAQLPQMMKMQPYPFTSPVEVLLMTDIMSATYLHAFYALKNPDALYIHTTFVTVLLNFLRYIEQHWQELVEDIRQGAIASVGLALTSEVKQGLLEELQPDPKRADELQQICERGFEGMARRIWPNLQYARCLAGGTFSIYVDKCKPYLGSVPIYSAAHAASEGLFGINLWPGKRISRFVPVPQERYTEYIPVAETNSTNPTTLELSELEVGERYELVMTNFSGFYRYRMGDIITVVDRYHQLPIYELEGRAKTLLALYGEGTTEEMARWSIQKTVEKTSYQLVDYTTKVDLDSSPPRYVFFVELAECSTLSLTAVDLVEAELGHELDLALKTANPIYEDGRSKNVIESPRVVLLKPGTFDAVTTMLVAGGASPLSVKIPRYARREDLLALLQENSLLGF